MEDCSIVRVQKLQMLSLKVLYVRVITHVRLAVERSRRSRASASRWQSSARYDGEMPNSDQWTSVATLKSTCWRTGSQCGWWSTGVLWSERRVPCSNQTGGGVLNRLQPVPQSFRDAEEERVVVVQRQETNFLLASSDNDRTTYHRQRRASQRHYNVSQKKSPLRFLTFFPNGWKFFNQFLHTCYKFLSTLDYRVLFNYLQLWRSYAIISATTQRIFTFH